ncbi:hypothetical protein [Streptomyces sp. NPDC029554]|uniref:hypothetical protein n=1 Tax=Streptomyces sp. NPDC029554 TaxID=3155126 RepID=UPI0033FAFF47
MSTLRFENPPADGRRNGSYPSAGEVAAALKARPGQWAVVRTVPARTTAATSAYNIRVAKSAAYAPAGSFEAVSRSVDGEYRVYARYVGPVSAEGGESR